MLSYPILSYPIDLSIYLSIYLFFYLSIYPSIFLYIFICLSIYLFVCSSIYQSIKLSNYQTIYVSIHQFVHPSFHPSIHPSFYPSIYFFCFVYLSICIWYMFWTLNMYIEVDRTTNKTTMFRVLGHTWLEGKSSHQEQQ